MNIAKFIAAFKAELRKHGHIYHVEAVDTAIKAAVAAGTAASEDAPVEAKPVSKAAVADTDDHEDHDTHTDAAE